MRLSSNLRKFFSVYAICMVECTSHCATCTVECICLTFRAWGDIITADQRGGELAALALGGSVGSALCGGPGAFYCSCGGVVPVMYLMHSSTCSAVKPCAFSQSARRSTSRVVISSMLTSPFSTPCGGSLGRGPCGLGLSRIIAADFAAVNPSETVPHVPL